MIRILVVLVVLNIVVACSPEELPPISMDVDSPFETTLNIDDLGIDFDADDYAMITGWGQDRIHLDFISYWGSYQPTECIENCGPSLSIEFYDTELRGARDFNPEEVLRNRSVDIAPLTSSTEEQKYLVWPEFTGEVLPDSFCVELSEMQTFSRICNETRIEVDDRDYPLESYGISYSDGIMINAFRQSINVSALVEAPTVTIESVDETTVIVSFKDLNPSNIIVLEDGERLSGEDFELILSIDEVDFLNFSIIDDSLPEEAGLIYFITFIGGEEYPSRSFGLPEFRIEQAETTFNEVSGRVKVIAEIDGQEYITDPALFSGTDLFTIISSMPYEDNEQGDQTYIVHAEVELTLYNGVTAESIQIKSDDLPFAVAYPK